MMKLKIKRSDGVRSRYDTFEIDPGSGMTVLEALFKIQTELDDSLVFRYSCRGAVCGSCGMLINKIPRLACRTQLSALGREDIVLSPYPAIEENEQQNSVVLIEPLPHLPVIRDLIVDQEKFFEYYRVIQPTFRAGDTDPVRERKMDPGSVTELEKYTNCILCAVCFGACPVNGQDPDYLGPAALAKLYRFYADPRETGDDSRLLLVNDTSGWWGCRFHINCKHVCPKGVPPNLAIGLARQRLEKTGKKPAGLSP